MSADEAGVDALIDKCWMAIVDDAEEDIVMLDDEED